MKTNKFHWNEEDLIIESAVEKHLAGKHDQSKHGRSKKGTSYKSGKLTVNDHKNPDRGAIRVLSTSEDDAVVQRIAEDIFECKIETERGTYTVEVQGASSFGGGYVTVEGAVWFRPTGGKRSAEVGNFTRVINSGEERVYNSVFTLSDSHQGSGVGTTIMRHWEDQLARAGVLEMRVSAVTDPGFYNGAYTWAKYGYTPSDPRQVAGIFAELSYHLRYSPEGASARQKLQSKYGLSQTLTDEQIGKTLGRAFGVDLLKAMTEFPELRGVLSGTAGGVGRIEWDGYKETVMIGKSYSAAMQVVERWMRNKPVELENDDPLFWKEIKNAYTNQ